MTAFNLKIIALSAMFIDHIGVAFPEAVPIWFRTIGRLAFPIFVPASLFVHETHLCTLIDYFAHI